MLTTVHPSAAACASARSAPLLLVELPIWVVMEDEQPEGRPVGVLDELEHRSVTVGVSCREQGRRPIWFHPYGFSGPSSR